MDARYWRSAAEDEAMQDEHGFIWLAMLETIDVHLDGKRVLDAGCNRGAFLRLLADHYGIAEGFGYDPAAGAVEDASRLIGDRPLHFEAGDTVPKGWGDFDVAFSHAGFDASATRLALSFVPAAGHGHHEEGQLFDWLNYYCDQKLLLRFGR